MKGKINPVKNPMKESEQRKKDLEALGLPTSFNVQIDLIHGLAYVLLISDGLESINGSFSGRYSYTIPDLGPNKINIDVSQDGRILGLEDISRDMGQMAERWVQALKKAHRLQKKQIKTKQKKQIKTKQKKKDLDFRDPSSYLD